MKRQLKIFVLFASVAIYTISCSKEDAYKSKYASDGAIVYSGKMDSVKVFSGRNRVKITGLFFSDPNIVKYRVFSNSRRDSVEVTVKRTSGVDTARIFINNLPEGTQSFEIRTYNAAGNSSVPVYVTASVYGDNYQSSLVNRGVVDASLQTDGSARISWADVSSDAGVQNMEIKYTDKNGLAHDTIIPSVSVAQITSLPAIKVGSVFSYKTAFLPNPTAIDTFFTVFQPHSVKADVTSVYLSNYGPDFKGTLGSDGRFGNLNAPWVTNTGAMNKGSYGGYQHASWQSAGVITWETWNNTPVVDGRIYQVTSSPLPAGTYTVSYNYYSEVQQNSSVYVVVAAGGGGIPSVANLSSALGYSAMFSGANIGATSPNVTETKSFNFTLSAPQVVSLGVLGNIVGSGNPGSYFEIRSFSLVQN
ncbi:MAG: DUF5013 domain-containing protein [Bacteroidetes bacterium]|nr:DUF5013 domain-containing protein [Bacteroidota bacterium]